MKTFVNEHVERLINRRLDGEITPAEADELESELERSPEARRLLDEYARIDACAAAALQSHLAHHDGGVLSPTAGSHRSHRRSRWGWYVPGAMAACLAMALWMYPPGPAKVAESPRSDSGWSEHPRGQVGRASDPQRGLIPVSQTRSVHDLTLDRDALWFVTEKGQIYVIERTTSEVMQGPLLSTDGWSAHGGI